MLLPLIKNIMPYNPDTLLVLVISNQEPIAYGQTHNHKRGNCSPSLTKEREELWQRQDESSAHSARHRGQALLPLQVSSK